MLLTDYIRTFSGGGCAPIIHRASVDSIVSVNSNGFICDVNRTSNNAWFVLYIMYGPGRRSILFDGDDKWIPLKRRRMPYRLYVTTLKKSPLVHLSAYDMNVLRMEVDQYMEKNHVGELNGTTKEMD